MMVSNFTSIGFVLTTIATLWFLYKASKNVKVLAGVLLWMLIVGLLGWSGFYRNTEAFPPRFFYLLGPVLLFILLLFLSKKGHAFVDTLDIKWLTLLHTVRIPVEIILHYIFVAGLIPELMTYTGYNYDILSGLTAPIIFFAVFIKKWMGKKTLLIWNVICLALLLNILTIAVLSAQTPFQKLAFEQPNIGVAYFPFVWLPTVIVPIVMISHLAAIRQLSTFKK